MSKFDDIEPALCEAVDQAIHNGYLIISGDWGVKWEVEEKLWVWDSFAVHVRSCCILSAYLLANPPPAKALSHRGDPYKAAMIALDLDNWLLRDILNGCDGLPMHSGNFEDAYNLGSRMARVYSPVNVDYLQLQHPKSETRLRILPALESERDLLKSASL